MPRGHLRTTAFVALNLGYVSTFLDVGGALSTAGFVLAGFGLAKLCERRPGLKLVCVALLVGAFLVVRRYTFLDALLPDRWLALVYSTAGLSFLLFKVLHVVIEAAGGTLGTLTFGRYLNYCLSFTTFLIGPIQRYQDFSDQFDGRKASIEPGFEAHVDAVNRILCGLVKKFVLADYLRVLTLSAVPDVAALGPGELLLRTYLFYLYLYLDFSGYCDVVIGAGSLTGNRPPENFNLPMLARNVSDYWLRVHRSLTTWLTDFVFNPTFASALRAESLRGHPLLATSLALIATMLISGLWHGTTLAFFMFGVVHAVYLVTHRAFEHNMLRALGRQRMKELRDRIWYRVASTFLTFNVTAAAYLFFVLDTGDLVALKERYV